ncbi:MAG TPA: LamG domain-containing protein, partial [Oligoflexia bacterium]|nr:LamG domain-containing protein [Oligoflexia bacterium]
MTRAALALFFFLHLTAFNVFGEGRCLLRLKLRETGAVSGSIYSLEQITPLYTNELYPLHPVTARRLRVIGAAGTLAEYGLPLMRVTALDAFENGQPELQLSAEEAVDIVIPYQAGITGFSLNDGSSTIPLAAGLNLSCEKTCAEENEQPGSLGCCPWTKRVAASSGVNVCIACGNGICGPSENGNNCPEDCATPEISCGRFLAWTRSGCNEGDLVAKWDFDNNMNDTAYLNRHFPGRQPFIAQPHNGMPTFTSDSLISGGLQERAVRLTTLKMYIASPSPFLSPSGDWTISVWIKPDNLLREQAVLSAENGVGRYFWFGTDASGRAAVKTGGEAALVSAQPLPAGWSHVTVSEEAAPTVVTRTLYVNGRKEQQAVYLLPSAVKSAEKLYIGSLYRKALGTPRIGFIGNIDRLLVFERPLDGGEVQDLYRVVCIANTRIAADCAAAAPPAVSGLQARFDE